MNKNLTKAFFGKTILLISILLLVVGCGIMPQEEETLAPPLLEQEQITYRTVKAEMGFIENSFTCTGSFVPLNQKDLYFNNMSGQLKAIYVNSGDTVTAGTILAELLSEGKEEEFKLQQLVVDSNQDSYTLSENIYNLDIDTAQKKLTEDQASYGMMIDMKDGYTQQELNAFKSGIEEQQLSLEKLTLNATYNLDIKANELEMSKIKLQQIKDDLEACYIVSPIDGIVTYIANIKEGDYVDAFINIVSIADPSAVQLQYSGEKAQKFTLGMEVTVTIQKVEYRGKVVFTPDSVPLEDKEKVYNTVRVVVENLPNESKSGDKADIKVVTASADDVLKIPIGALKTYLGKDVVYVLEDNFRVEKFVEIGIKSNNDVQIINGINLGDNIIVE